MLKWSRSAIAWFWGKMTTLYGTVFLILRQYRACRKSSQSNMLTWRWRGMLFIVILYLWIFNKVRMISLVLVHNVFHSEITGSKLKQEEMQMVN